MIAEVKIENEIVVEKIIDEFRVETNLFNIIVEGLSEVDVNREYSDAEVAAKATILMCTF
jgi:hypothetical protein